MDIWGVQKKKFLTKAALCLAAVLLAGGLGEARAALRLEQVAEIRREVTEFQRQHGLVGLSVSVSSLSGQVITIDLGEADRSQGRAVDSTSTRFRWASLSKGMTGIIAQKLVSRGVVDLDRDIRDYLRNYPMPRYWVQRTSEDPIQRSVTGADGGRSREAAGEPFVRHRLPRGTRVTLRRLLTNTAGIQSYDDGLVYPVPPYHMIRNRTYNTGLEWAVRHWWSGPFVSIPGSKYNYSTFSFNLAAVVLEHASGKRFPTLVREFISGPLNLSSLDLDYGWNQPAENTLGYRRASRGAAIQEEQDIDVSWKAAGGGMISTPADLHKYCRAVAGSQFLTSSEKTQVFRRHRLTGGNRVDYGLGWGVEENIPSWGRRFSHDGNQAKTRTRIEIYPDAQDPVCVTLMTNTRIPRMTFNVFTQRLADLARPSTAMHLPAVRQLRRSMPRALDLEREIAESF